MCEKCKELDGKIEHYQRLSKLLIDKQALEGVEVLVAGHQGQKKAMRPENP